MLALGECSPCPEADRTLRLPQRLSHAELVLLQVQCPDPYGRCAHAGHGPQLPLAAARQRSAAVALLYA